MHCRFTFLLLFDERSLIISKAMLIRKVHNKTCELCGRRYKAFMSNSRFCSDACRARNWRENNTKEESEGLKSASHIKKSTAIIKEERTIDLTFHGVFHEEQDLYNMLVPLLRNFDISGLMVKFKVPMRNEIIELGEFLLRRRVGAEDRYDVEML